MTREICDWCAEESAVGFSVPDELWQKVADAIEGFADILCLRCFTQAADGLMLEWDADIYLSPLGNAKANLPAPRGQFRKSTTG